jgi:hypothetical protein
VSEESSGFWRQAVIKKSAAFNRFVIDFQERHLML